MEFDSTGAAYDEETHGRSPLEPRPGADHQGEASGTGRKEVVPGDLQVELVGEVELVGVVGAYLFGGVA